MGSHKSNKCRTQGTSRARITACFFAAFLAAFAWADFSSADTDLYIDDYTFESVPNSPNLLEGSESYTLQQVIDAGGIVIGDKLFDSFTVTTVKSTGAVAPGASEIRITPIQILKSGEPFGGDYGMRFNSLWSATPGGLSDSTISFHATILPSYAAQGYAFTDNSLWLTGYGATSSSATGSVSVAENLYDVPPSSMTPSFADELAYYNTSANKKPSDTASFEPRTEMWIVKDVGAVGGIGDTGFAHLSEFYQTFSQTQIQVHVPEPGTLVIVLGAAAGLGGYLCRKRRA